jgi:nucleotide-binding universal stress UspA family protein
VCAKVLLAYDGTAPARNAFDAVLRLPQTQRTELKILAVVRASTFAVDYGAQTILENAIGEISVRMARLQRKAQFAGTAATAVVRVGNPVDHILRAAREWQADLIVTGHRSGWARLPWFWDSVSNRVRSLAPCAVLVVSRGSNLTNTPWTCRR